MCYPTKFIRECLLAGHLTIDTLQRQLVIDGQLKIAYEKVCSDDWGYIYEKFVGQELEKQGFKVTYHGLLNTMRDGGVDLIAEKGDWMTYIQCKYSAKKKKLSKSHIEKIHFKASKKLLEAHNAGGKRLAFALMVHSKADSFRRAPLADDPNKIMYPWLAYFLRYNQEQNKVKFGFKEVPMQV